MDMYSKYIIFTPFTSFQLLTSVYYVKQINDKSIRKILIWTNFTKENIPIQKIEKYFDKVIVIKDFYKENIIKKQFFKLVNAGWLFRFSDWYKYLAKDKEKERILICFSDQNILTHKIATEINRYKGQIILVEEGVNTYLIPENKKARDWYFNKLIGAKSSEYIGQFEGISTFFVRHPESLPQIKKNGRKVILQNDIFLEQSWIKEFIDNSRNAMFSCDILWLGQPLISDNIEDNTQIELLKQLGQYGYQIIVRKHPRESAKKYAPLTNKKNICMFDAGDNGWLPIEVFAKLFTAKVILSAYSSAGINMCNYMKKCKCIFCYPMFGLKIDKSKITGEFSTVTTTKEIIECINNKQNYLIEENPIEQINQNKDIQYIQNILYDA